MADEYRLKFITEWESNHTKASKEMQDAIHKVSAATNELHKEIDAAGDSMDGLFKGSAKLGTKDFEKGAMAAGKAVHELNIEARQAASTEKDLADGADTASSSMRTLNKEEIATKNTTKELKKEAKDTGSQLKEMVKQAAALGGISLGAAGIKAFAAQMINVRKEMQSLNTSFRVLLGNQQAADKMFNELRRFAATTPLMMNDLASSAQTMLGFGIEANKVIPTLKAIGDISKGNGESLKSLTLAFSQMSSTGKLMGQDLMQMINAGFNPLMEISKKTGKEIGQLKEEMSKGAISAEMVADAFMSATSVGGQFYGMLAEKGKDVEGQINQMNGAINDMFDELGKSSDNAITTAISGVTTLVQNYETVGKVIASLVATYGTYRAAIIVTNAIEMTNRKGIEFTIALTKRHVLATKAATVAQAAFNAVAKANPYVLLATAIVAAGTAIWAFSKHVDEATQMQSKFTSEREKFNKSLTDEKNEVQDLLTVIQDSNSTDTQRIEAYEKMKTKCHDLTDKYKLEELQVLKLADAYKILTNSQTKRTIEDLENQIDIRQKALDQLQKRQKRSADVQAFMNANDMTHKDVKEVKDMLEKQIAELKADLDTEKDAKAKADAKGKTNYSKAAADALKDWQDAKKTYDKLRNSKESTIEQVKEAQSKMDVADKKYEEITGKKASDATKSSTKDIKEAAKDAKELADLEKQLNIEKERAAKDYGFQAEQARIDGMKEGAEKVRAQIKLDYEKEKEAISREQDDLKARMEENARKLWEAQNADQVRKNPNAWITSGKQQEFLDTYTISDEAKKYYEERENTNNINQQKRLDDQEKAEKELHERLIAETGSYLQQREALQKSYERKINDADSQDEKDLLTAQMTKALNELDDKFGQSTSKLKKLFSDVSKKSRSEIKAMIADLKELQKRLKDGEISDEDQTFLSALGFTDEDLQKVKTGETTIQEVIDQLLNLKDSLDNTGNVFEQFWDSWEKGSDGKVDFDKVGKAFSNMIGQVSQYNKQMADLAGMLGAGHIQEAMQDVQTVVDEIGTGASIGASAGGGWGALVGAIIGTVSGIGKMFAAHADDFEIKAIERLQKKIDGLKRSYEDLETQVNKTYATDKQRNIESEINNLSRQNALIRQQVMMEENKKDSDASAIKNYNEAIDENKRRIKELKEQAKDAIFGSDINSAINSFSTAYADAWAQNTNRTKTAKEQVRVMMQDMIKEAIKASTQASGAMEKIRNKLADFFRDQIFTREEQNAIYREAEALQKELDAKFGWADKLLSNEGSFTQEATSGGFATMRQDSADELNGRFAESQMSLYRISDNTMAIASSMAEYISSIQSLSALSTAQNEAVQEIRNMMISVNANVEDIAIYTKSLTTFGAKFDEMNRKLEKL